MDSDMYSDISEATVSSQNLLDLNIEIPNLELDELMSGMDDVINDSSVKRKRKHREVDLLEVLPFREGPIASRTRSKTNIPTSPELTDIGPSSNQVRYWVFIYLIFLS